MLDITYCSKLVENNVKPVVSVILLDWSCRESFHSLRYLNQQTIPRNKYEILWIEYYTRKPPQITAQLKECKEKRRPAAIDQWIILGMPDNVCYHKHLMYNIGIVKSRGDIIVICDSDAIFRPTFIKTIIKSFKNNPDIVMHLDEVRNGNKKFYPFSYPSIRELLRNGCTNWKDGKTTGLWDKSDPIHTRNYGACMAAKRTDLIGIGGADEYMDYVGHVCGPYEMTFRLINAGKKEIWHQSEFLYHAWHPGQSGDKNYVGPHDGRLISTTALDALRSGRIMPLVENEAIKILRTDDDVSKQKLQEKLVDFSYAKCFSYETISKDGKANPWYTHELITSYKDYNIVQYRDKVYGVPKFLNLNDLDREEGVYHPTIITAKTQKVVEEQIENFDTSYFIPQIIEVYKDYNLTRYGCRIYGVPQTLSDLDLHKPQQRRIIAHLSALTVQAVKELINKTDRSTYFPVMIESYEDYNIVKYQGKVYGVPSTLRGLELHKPEQRQLIRHLSAATTKDVKKLIDKTERSTYFPVITEVYKDYNIVIYQGKVYGVPTILRGLELHKPEQRALVEHLSAQTPAAVKELIDHADPLYFHPVMIGSHHNFNIIKYQGKLYGVPQHLGKVDFTQGIQRLPPDILSADTQDEVELLIRQRLSVDNNIDNKSTIMHQQGDALTPEKTDTISHYGMQMNESSPIANIPILLYEYKNYNIIRYNDYYYAVPHSIGPVDFSDDEQRRHPEVISAGKRSELQTRIDQLENSMPVEYAGWLPSFKQFGNCGYHPQFAHIDTPPPGYRFTYSKPRQDNPPIKRRVWQGVVFLVRGSFIFVATLKFIMSAWSKGARLRDIFHFLKTRDLKSQFLLSRKRKLLFLPSVPYAIGQHPWVIELEDSISFLFPFFHNGQTTLVNFYESPYFPIFKALIESKQCRGIVTHIKSTAESLPKLFKNDKLSSKITYEPLGVKLPMVFRDINKKDNKVQLLFNNSWHQDPRSFFLRGGLDALSAFDKLRIKYPNVFLTLRTPLPKLLDPHYIKIIEHNGVRVIDKFLPDHEWELLMRNSDIYLIPSARIHVVSILEAMSYGLVVVTSDGWGTEEYIQHGINGMIVKGRYGKTSWMEDKTGMLRENYKPLFQKDPIIVKGLVELLSSLVEDRDLLNRISKQARKDIETNYNLENWNNGLKIAFDKAFLNNGRGKRR